MKSLIAIFTVATILFSNAVTAEIITDGTVGSAVEISGPVYNINSDLGIVADDNLYHSFNRFNIGANEIANFSSTEPVTNVIARVTGGGISTINGTISSTIADANLYLINNSGIIFGSEASLNISGSFFVSTCDYIEMDNGDRLYSQPFVDDVLSSASPIKFGFLNAEIAGIQFEGRDGTGISVNEEEKIFIAGGDITISGGGAEGLASANLSAAGGGIEIVSMNSVGSVLSDSDTPEVICDKLGTVTITENGLIDISGEDEGEIYIRSGRFVVDNSKIKAGNSDQVLDLLNPGEGGTVNIQSREILLNNGGRIESSASGLNDAGYIEIHDCDSLTIINNSSLTTSTSGEGDAGSIFINADTLTIGEHSTLSSSSTGTGDQGNAGFIHIQGATDITLSGNSLINTSSEGEGNAGYIYIDTANLSINNSTLASTNAEGDIEDVRDYFDPDDDADDDDFTDPPEELGGPGSIFVNADRVDLTGFSFVTTSTNGIGDAGHVDIHSGEVYLSGESKITSSSLAEIGGKAGVIEVSGCNVAEISENAAIETKTIGRGAAGDILLQVKKLAVKEDGKLRSSSSGTGNAGYIEINSDTVIIENGKISSSSTAVTDAGDAGVININAEDSISITGGGSVRTESENSGGGAIGLLAKQVVYIKDSRVSTNVKNGEGQSGNIDLNAAFIVMDKGKVTANADLGNGGNILFRSNYLIKSWDSMITASSNLGIDGKIEIDTPDSDIPGGVAPLRIELIDAEKWASTPCSKRTGDTTSSLSVSGEKAVEHEHYGRWYDIPMSEIR